MVFIMSSVSFKPILGGVIHSFTDEKWTFCDLPRLFILLLSIKLVSTRNSFTLVMIC